MEELYTEISSLIDRYERLHEHYNRAPECDWRNFLAGQIEETVTAINEKTREFNSLRKPGSAERHQGHHFLAGGGFTAILVGLVSSSSLLISAGTLACVAAYLLHLKSPAVRDDRDLLDWDPPHVATEPDVPTRHGPHCNCPYGQHPLKGAWWN